MMERRSFLRGSMFSIAWAALPEAMVFGGQDQTQSSAQQPEPQDGGQRNQSEPQAPDGTPPVGDSSNAADKDPSKITHKDADGLEYRECPQCGFNMYRQDRTWTCENCGYSYTE
jgi:ribosomal protein S27AE